MRSLTLVALLASLAAAQPPATIRADQPGDRAVYQRDARGHAALPVVCTLPGDPVEVVEVQAQNRATGQPVGEWLALALTDGSWRGKLVLPTGWYKLVLRARRGPAVVSVGGVEHVGVGEVLITCGQSNSANHGQPPQKASDDRVSSRDFGSGRWAHGDDPQPGATGTGGSPWALLGDLLADRLDAPVGLVCVGVGGTPVSYWLPGQAGYARLRRALELVGPQGARAVLWHQGESDSIAGTSADEYGARLRATIEQSRRDGGWAVPWGVALAAFHPAAEATAERQAAVIAGQRRVIAEVPDVFLGAETDSFHERGMLTDTVHFNAKGLAAHAQGWFEALLPRLAKQERG